MSNLIYFTKEEKQFLYEGLNALMVDKMAEINRTRSSSWLYEDPEEVREKIYDEMDLITDLLDKLEVFND